MIRTAQILISYEHLAHLRAYASLHDAGPAENVLETVLAAWVEQHPELTDLIKREQAAKKQARADWKSAWTLPL